MATIPQALDLAFEYHRAGDLRRAEEIYLRILQADPSHADAWHLLGGVAYQRGQLDDAVRSMQRAVELNPSVAAYHCNAGLALTALGRLDEAVISLRRALELEPASVDAHFNLANALQAQGNLDEAEACYRQVLRLAPRLGPAFNNLGAVYLRQGRLEEATACLRQAVLLAPRQPDCHHNLGTALLRQDQVTAARASLGEAVRLRPDDADARLSLSQALLRDHLLEEALAHAREAARLRPASAAAHRQLGVLLCQLRRHEEATAGLRRALELEPESAEALYCLGVALREQGCLDEAVARGREAVRSQPELAEAHNQLGVSLTRAGRPEESLACYGRVLQLDPNHANAHVNRAMTWLLLGDYARAWPEYEWRWRRPDVRPRSFPEPSWQGEPLAGRAILLHAEQGLGDTLQFIRYARLVKERGATVLLQGPEALLGVLRSCPGLDRLVGADAPLPPFDAHAPLLSLPNVFHTTLESIPAQVPYLHADPTLSRAWRGRLAALPGLKVGIAWQGDPGHPWDRFRSIPLAAFEALARVPGVRLVSLQRGPGSEQLAQLGGRFEVANFPGRAEGPAQGWVDTAALVSALDLVITVDTAVAHLAGALGIRTWVVLNTSPDWRWLMGRADSPWYPTVRLFRQNALGDWEGVFRRLAEAVAELRAAGTP